MSVAFHCDISVVMFVTCIFRILVGVTVYGYVVNDKQTNKQTKNKLSMIPYLLGSFVVVYFMAV